MLPPRLVRRLVLAPLTVVIAVAVAVVFPLLAAATLLFDLVSGPRSGRRRVLRLVFFALVWLFADAAAVFMCLGLWLVSGLRRAAAHRAVPGAALRDHALVPRLGVPGRDQVVRVQGQG